MLIYKATNKLNGKCYIGQTKGTLAQRREAHLAAVRDFPKKGRYFQWALREFGEDAFAWEVLCRCTTAKELDEREREFIRQYGADDPDRGYNLAQGGGGRPTESLAQALAALRPRDVVLTQTLLDTMGISSKLANWYLGSGWLERFGPRAFCRPGDSVDWRGGLYALQTQLGMTIHAAALTALELQGRAHYLPLGAGHPVKLVSDRSEHLPTWFKNHPWRARIQHHTLALFGSSLPASTTKLNCGSFEVAMSSPERAILEELRLAQTNAAIEHSLQLMENLVTLRPRLLQELLEACQSIKVKRLFLWTAERAQHAWVEDLDVDRIELGSGKRQLYKGGQFNAKYQITVPEEEQLPDV